MSQLTLFPLTLEELEEASSDLGIPMAHIEKDWYVIQTLRFFAPTAIDSSINLIFTGGTSLCKCHQIIHRFSEDIDFRIASPPLSKPQRSALRKDIIRELRTFGFKIDDNDIQARNQSRFFSIRAKYPRGDTIEAQSELRPFIKIEMTFEGNRLPTKTFPISSYTNQLKQEKPEIPQFSCLSTTEIAAEKLSALTWRVPDRNREFETDDPTIVRHIYDLAMLEKRVVSDPHFSQTFYNVNTEDIEEKRRSRSLSTFKTCPTDTLLKLKDILQSDPLYSEEYRRYVMSMVYRQSEAMSYVDALKALSRLIDYTISRAESA